MDCFQVGLTALSAQKGYTENAKIKSLLKIIISDRKLKDCLHHSTGDNIKQSLIYLEIQQSNNHM